MVMNTFIKKLKYTPLLAILLVTGCTKNFEDINTDPDALKDVPPQNMLVNVLRSAGEQFGGDVDGYGTFAGYIVKIQYPDNLGGLNPTNNTYGNRWAACYENITQMKDLLKKTDDKAQVYKNIRIVAKIWNNYMWSYLLDGWGDIPYSEAFKGRPEDGSVLKAKYDKQEDIFPAVLADLKTLADELAAGVGTDELGAYDVIYFKDGRSKDEAIQAQMLNWQKFCNSLRMRIAMRISAVAPALSKATIEEIAGNKDKYPVIERNADNCQLAYPGNLPYMEPWYKTGINDARLNNWGMFDIFINHMNETKDPRIASIARKNNAGEYVGFVNGAENNPSPLSSISWIGENYINNPAGTTPFYNACETYYILAEAALAGYNVGISAKDAYEKAVSLSMEDNKINAAAIATYLAGAGQFDGTKERIYWDMWIALFKQNFEAWNLYRRTGIPTTNYPSKLQKFEVNHTDQPWRLPYPNNEYLYNTENTKAASAGVVDFAWGKRLWWAKDNGKN